MTTARTTKTKMNDGNRDERITTAQISFTYTMFMIAPTDHYENPIISNASPILHVLASKFSLILFPLAQSMLALHPTIIPCIITPSASVASKQRRRSTVSYDPYDNIPLRKKNLGLPAITQRPNFHRPSSEIAIPARVMFHPKGDNKRLSRTASRRRTLAPLPGGRPRLRQSRSFERAKSAGSYVG